MNKFFACLLCVMFLPGCSTPKVEEKVSYRPEPIKVINPCTQGGCAAYVQTRCQENANATAVNACSY